AACRETPSGTLGWLRGLHRSHEPARGPYCFCMHRADAATVSYTEVTVSRTMGTMRYWPGAPCCTEPGAASRIARGARSPAFRRLGAAA
ncbi:MAG: hypothetical protein AB1705_07975, partial [Verrucomicrobiota bacterium]